MRLLNPSHLPAICSRSVMGTCGAPGSIWRVLHARMVIANHAKSQNLQGVMLPSVFGTHAPYCSAPDCTENEWNCTDLRQTLCQTDRVCSREKGSGGPVEVFEKPAKLGAAGHADWRRNEHRQGDRFAPVLRRPDAEIARSIAKQGV